MSVKHATKKNKKQNQKDNRLKGTLLMVVFVVLFVIAIALVVQPQGNPFDETKGNATGANKEETTETYRNELEDKLEIEDVDNMYYKLSHGIKITKVGRYTGLYMEDGSNELVSGVLMIVVENIGDEYIQYAEITMGSGDSKAKFILTTFFPGDTMVVLESTRQEYKSDMDYSVAVVNNVAVFSQAPTLYEGKLEIQPLNGVLNVTNVSDSAITGDVVIYYKNCIKDMLYGGVTYRVRITGGIKSGEIKQIVADHFSADGSEIMFIVCE